MYIKNQCFLKLFGTKYLEYLRKQTTCKHPIRNFLKLGRNSFSLVNSHKCLVEGLLVEGLSLLHVWIANKWLEHLFKFQMTVNKSQQTAGLNMVLLVKLNCNLIAVVMLKCQGYDLTLQYKEKVYLYGKVYFIKMHFTERLEYYKNDLTRKDDSYLLNLYLKV